MVQAGSEAPVFVSEMEKRGVIGMGTNGISYNAIKNNKTLGEFLGKEEELVDARKEE